MTPLVKFELRANQDLIKCEVCGKTVKGGQGLYGHLLLKHGIRKPKRETRLAEEVERLMAEIAWKDQQITNQKRSYEATIEELKDRCVELKQERGIKVDSLLYKWKYCPECGQPRAKHKEHHDLAWGDYYECPNGGKAK